MTLEFGITLKYLSSQPRQTGAAMHIPSNFWHRQPRNASAVQDWLEHVVVGDPDPTSDHSVGNRSLKCQFQWADEVSSTLVLPWSCTRELGHPGQHLAGTGQRVVAVHPAVLFTVAATDQKARELSARGDCLREQGKHLAEKVACVLSRLATTEEHLADTFARSALAAPHRADQLSRLTRLARADVHRLRSKQAHLCQATLPGHLRSQS
jgi:hypothetical protein